MAFEGVFKSMKDYIQPIIFALALTLPSVFGSDEMQRSAVIIGLVYMCLHVLSAVASRYSHGITEGMGSQHRAARLLWFINLLVYALVNFGALRLIGRAGIHRVLVWVSVAACLFAILIWVLHTFKTSPGSLVIFLFFLIISFVTEGLLQRFLGRRIDSQEHENSPLDSQ